MKVRAAVWVDGACSQQAYDNCGSTWHQCTSTQIDALQRPPVSTFGAHLRGCSAQPPDGHLKGAFFGQGGHVNSLGGQSPPYARSAVLGVHEMTPSSDRFSDLLRHARGALVFAVNLKRTYCERRRSTNDETVLEERRSRQQPGRVAGRRGPDGGEGLRTASETPGRG